MRTAILFIFLSVTHAVAVMPVAVPTNFDVRFVKNIKAHYDIREYRYLANETIVTNWTDLTGNGNTVYQSGVNSPNVRKYYSSVNGWMGFAGYDGRFTNHTFSISQPCAVFAAVDASNVAGYIFDGVDSVNRLAFGYNLAGSDTVGIYAGSALTADSGRIGGFYPPAFLTGIFDTTNSTIRRVSVLSTAINEVSSTGDTGTNVLNAGITIGARYNNASPIWQMSELVIVTGIPTAGEVKEIELYFGWQFLDEP